MRNIEFVVPYWPLTKLVSVSIVLGYEVLMFNLIDYLTHFILGYKGVGSQSVTGYCTFCYFLGLLYSPSYGIVFATRFPCFLLSQCPVQVLVS